MSLLLLRAVTFRVFFKSGPERLDPAVLVLSLSQKCQGRPLLVKILLIEIKTSNFKVEKFPRYFEIRGFHGLKTVYGTVLESLVVIESDKGL